MLCPRFGRADLRRHVQYDRLMEVFRISYFSFSEEEVDSDFLRNEPFRKSSDFGLWTQPNS